MKRHSLFFSFLFVLVFTAQQSTAQEQKTDSELITELISKKRDFNKKFGYGYRIQLYNGFEVEARKMQAKFRIEFPDIKTYLTYSQPEWKIQIGLYKSELEADRILNELGLKKKFGAGVIVVPLGK